MSEDKKILGIDLGEKRIGLAIAEGDLAEPLTIIEVSKQDSALEKIVEICQQERVQKIVLGLPLESEGRLGPQAQKVKRFGRKLAEVTGLKIIFWDETLTSKEALAKMVEAGKPVKKRRFLDDVAAALILQEYLDSQ